MRWSANAVVASRLLMGGGAKLMQCLSGAGYAIAKELENPAT